MVNGPYKVWPFEVIFSYQWYGYSNHTNMAIQPNCTVTVLSPTPIFPAFELVGPESFIVYSPGGLSHFPSQYRIYHILFYLHSHINDIYVPKVRL